MKFLTISQKAASPAFLETNRQVMMRRLHRNFHCGQSIRVSSLLTTTTSMSVIHPRIHIADITENTRRINNTYKHASAFGASNRWMSFFSPSKSIFEKIVVKVPTMGDSITEGTIVEWTAAVGQAVKTDDVIALIETDKVTIDIKADMNGVITQHFGSVDETVEVGAKLYELDTEAVALVMAPAVPAQPTDSSSQSEPAPTQNNVPSHKVATSAAVLRSPSIQFLGKDGWEALRKGHDTTKQALNVASISSPKKYAVKTIVDDKNVKDPMYGRPKFTEAEMEALLTGGATLAPHVLSLSTGAKFKL